MNKNLNSAFKKGRGTNQSEKDLEQIILGNSSGNTDLDELEKRESELKMRELKFIAKQLLLQNGLPVEIADILRLDDEESIEKAVEMLAKLDLKKENDEHLKVLDEKKLPKYQTEEKHMGELRKAFGLI